MNCRIVSNSRFSYSEGSEAVESAFGITTAKSRVGIVCTHRLADEEMWTAALNAGAADIYPSYDTRGILSAAVRNASMARSIAA